ncbi:ArnT family glycosyltransferase [Candidatus Zixiibacteriota bacterium]
MMGIPKTKGDRFWQRPAFACVLLPGLAMLFNWPYLMGGFFADDILFLNILKIDPLPFSRWLGMWATPAADWGMLDSLWWGDQTSTTEFGVFWRPLPSLVFEGSLRLFGENAFPLHLLSILLHGGVALGIYQLLRRLTNHHWLALLAGIFFVACEDHTMGIGWIATISGLLAVQFIVLALLAHVHWLQRRKKKYFCWSLIALVLALACKETASVAAVGMLLLTFLLPSGFAIGDHHRVGLRPRIVQGLKDPWSWVPALLIMVGYLVLYRAAGFGVYHSLMYVSPLAEPFKYLAHAVQHLPIMWLATLSPFPPMVIVYLPELLPPLAVAGTIAFLAFLVALWPFRHRSVIQWALVLYLVALLPELAVGASERGLYFPLVPASVLLATVAVTIAPLAKRLAAQTFTGARWTRIMGWAVVVGVLIPGVILSAAWPWAYLPGFELPEKELRTAMPWIEKKQPEHVLMLNTSGFMNAVYVWDILNHLSRDPLDVHVLSSANGIIDLEKRGDSSLVIRTDRVGWLDNFMARLVRSKEEFVIGRRYATPLFAAIVKKITPDGKDVLEVQFDFNRSLADAGLLFMRWNGVHYEPLDMSNLANGNIVRLADTSKLW